MRAGGYYKNKLSGLTLRYKGIVVGVNIDGNIARVWGERVFKVMNERMAFKTDNILDTEFQFKEAGTDVVAFVEQLEKLVADFLAAHPLPNNIESFQPEVPEDTARLNSDGGT